MSIVKMLLPLHVLVFFFSFCNAGLLTRIIGGTEAEPGDYPYHVSLQKNRGLHCGGTIISDQWILTAAHCVHNIRNISSLSVVAGSVNLRRPLVRYGIQKVIVHEQYRKNVSLFRNDIALVKTNRVIVFNTSLVQPAFLSVDLSTKNLYNLTGYQGGTILKYMLTSLLNKTECQSALRGASTITDSHICSFTTSKIACRGDSGGGLTFVSNGKRIIAGILSQVLSRKGMCDILRPAYYVKVGAYINWLNDNMKQ